MRHAVLPYFLAMAAAFLTLPLPPETRTDGAGALLIAAAALLTIIGGVWAVAVHARQRATWSAGGWAPALPAYLLFLAIGCMRHAEGQSASGFGVLVLLPLVYLALHSGRRQLVMGIICMGLMFALPILVFGAPEYPAIEWRRTLLWLVIGSIASFTIHRLVNQVRSDARVASADSRTDPLTGLANRRAMTDSLHALLARAGRRDEPIVVAMIDVDHFKRFNDTHGHAEGDRLLREAARAWQGQLRADDLLARYGGEEFLAILPGCTLTDAQPIAERLLAATPDDETCSIGLAAWDGGEQGVDLIARADSALYEAKRAGRARVVEAAEPLGA